MSHGRISGSRLKVILVGRNLILSYAISAIVWVGGSLFYLSTLPAKFWIFRDDSVIHLSQAKNLALFGSIGLSPGDRVEAMSSPLNFAIAAITYAINPSLSYENYLRYFLVLTLLGLSISINFALRSILHKSNRNNLEILTGINLSIFLLGLSSWTTFGWLISGMENVLCVTLMFFLIGVLYKENVNILLAICFATLLGLCRIEMAILIGPLLLLSSLRIQTGTKRKVSVVLAPIIIWSVIHIFRFVYFGHLLPNTATALNKNLSPASIVFIGVEYVLILLAILKHTPRVFGNILITRGLSLVLIGTGIFRINSASYSTSYKLVLIASLLGIGILLFLLFRARQFLWKWQLLILVSIMPLNHYFLFGPARLSAFRIVSIFVIPVIALFIVSVSTLDWKIDKGRKMIFLLLPFALILIMGVSKIDPPRNLCCAISPSESYINKQAVTVFDNSLNSHPLPIVANPDLGKISFTKNLVNVDLGLIGEPVLAKFMRDSPGLVDEYLIDLVAPDIIELHGHWKCVYSDLLKNPKFASQWDLVWSGYVSKEMNPPVDDSCPGSEEYSIWKRNIPSDERDLSLAIASMNFKGYSKLIKSELTKCENKPNGCEYIARSIIRNKASLISDKTLGKTVKLMEGSDSFRFNEMRVLQPRKWDIGAYSAAKKMIERELITK